MVLLAACSGGTEATPNDTPQQNQAVAETPAPVPEVNPEPEIAPEPMQEIEDDKSQDRLQTYPTFEEFFAQFTEEEQVNIRGYFEDNDMDIERNFAREVNQGPLIATAQYFRDNPNAMNYLNEYCDKQGCDKLSQWNHGFNIVYLRSNNANSKHNLFPESTNGWESRLRTAAVQNHDITP